MSEKNISIVRENEDYRGPIQLRFVENVDKEGPILLRFVENGGPILLHIKRAMLTSKSNMKHKKFLQKNREVDKN